MTLAVDETVEVVAEPITANPDDGIAVTCVVGSSFTQLLTMNYSKSGVNNIVETVYGPIGDGNKNE